MADGVMARTRDDKLEPVKAIAQEDLASESGIGRSYVGSIERGSKTPASFTTRWTRPRLR